mmetsp:Transcript_24391/g.39078  ORF Transcript_24391/g.39078 Transcript_24391/m.39078 type:complete len:838 (+) Transcript_24391:91-2604(+)
MASLRPRRRVDSDSGSSENERSRSQSPRRPDAENQIYDYDKNSNRNPGNSVSSQQQLGMVASRKKALMILAALAVVFWLVMQNSSSPSALSTLDSSKSKDINSEFWKGSQSQERGNDLGAENLEAKDVDLDSNEDLDDQPREDPMEAPIGEFDKEIVDTEEIEDSSGFHINVDDLDSMDQTAESIKVCVQGPNPRVASLFVRNGLREFGSKLEFVMAPMLRDQLDQYITSGAISSTSLPPAEPCQPQWPRLNLAFQKGLTPRTVATPGQTTFVVGDEYCKCLLSLCGGQTPAVPMRQYYTNKFTSDYLPLGSRFEFQAVTASEIRPPSSRKYVFNFAGALTSNSRRVLAKILEDGAKATGILSRGFVNVAPAWKKDAMTQSYVSPQEYRAAVLDSTFTLCPAGTNPEAFRIFEAIDSGSIPILVRDEEYNAHPCQDAFKPLLDSGAPIVVLNDWSELEETMTQILPKADAIQQKLLVWRRAYWTNIAAKVDCTILSKYSSDTGQTHDLESTCAKAKSALPTSSRSTFTKRTNPMTTVKSLGNPIGVPSISSSPAQSESTTTTTTTTHPSSRTSVTQSDTLAMTPQVIPVDSSSQIPLITGCGRSGTLSLMEYLRSIGVSAVHEQVQTAHVSVSWLYAVETSLYPFEFKSSNILRKKIRAMIPADKPMFSPVVHLTRHPLKVMSSTRRCFCGKGDRSLARGAKNDERSWVFAQKFLPRMSPDLPFESLERSAIYWLEWNKLIEHNYPSNTHVRLEDVDPAVLVKALRLEGIDTTALPRSMPRAKFHTSPDKEKQRLPDVTWTELHEMDANIATEVFNLAQHYGYELDTTLEDNLALGK